ncbi:hypothetical protein GG496_001283 [Candidatus Fervidibacteria bacterium JGI MDM2 JNZ-1-D12]
MEKWLGDKLIVGLIVLLLVANLWMLGRNLGLSFSPQPPKSFLESVLEETWKKYLKGDPPLGTEISELKPFKGKRLVVVIERCTDCIAGALKSWSEVVKRSGLPKMVLVTGDKPEQARQVLDKWGIDVEVVSDLKGEIIKKLNVFFTPRIYVFKNGQLTWKQNRPDVEIREVIWR